MELFITIPFIAVLMILMVYIPKKGKVWQLSTMHVLAIAAILAWQFTHMQLTNLRDITLPIKSIYTESEQCHKLGGEFSAYDNWDNPPKTIVHCTKETDLKLK